MNLQTTIELPELPFKINHNDKIVMLGSCFSTEIGNKFQYYGYETMINPLGTVYNPASIAYQLDILTDFNEDDLNILERDGQFIFFDGNTDFVSNTKEELVAQIKQKADAFVTFLKEAKVCFITLGSSKVYQHQSNGEIVANCQKLPANEFEEAMLLPDMVTSFLMVGYDAIKRINPMIDVVFTVSPVRYIADGLVNNTRSKASLHVGVASALPECEDGFYFPSYEIVVDELRDYRFYSDDFAHINHLGVNYVWEKVKKTFLTTTDEHFRNQVDKFRKLQNHRVLGGEEAEQKHFQAIQHKMLTLAEQYPHLSNVFGL